MPDQAPYSNDHDILISVHTRLETVQGDIKEIKESTQLRIADLEAKKLDKASFEKIYQDAQIVHKDIDKRATDELKDHETRLRRLEYAYFLSTGILLAVQFYFQYFKR